MEIVHGSGHIVGVTKGVELGRGVTVGSAVPGVPDVSVGLGPGVGVSEATGVSDAVGLGPGVNVALGTNVPDAVGLAPAVAVPLVADGVVAAGEGVAGSGVVVISFGVSVGPGVALGGCVATPVGNGANVADPLIVGNGDASDNVAVACMGGDGSSAMAKIWPATNPPQKRQATMASMSTLCGRDIRRPVPLCAGFQTVARPADRYGAMARESNARPDDYRGPNAIINM